MSVYNASNAGVEIKSGTTGQSSVFFTDTADSNIGMIGYFHSDNSMFFRTNDAEAVRITSAGDVGIGEDSPVSRLHLANTGSGNVSMTITNDTTGHTSGNGVEIGMGADEQAQIWNYENSHFRIGTNNTEKLRITADGQLQATGAADVRLTLGSGGTAGTNDSVHMRADGASLKFMKWCC